MLPIAKKIPLVPKPEQNMALRANGTTSRAEETKLDVTMIHGTGVRFPLWTNQCGNLPLLQRLLTFDYYLADEAGNGGQNKGQVKRRNEAWEEV